MQSCSGTEEENSVSSLESSLARVTVSGQSLPSLHTVTCTRGSGTGLSLNESYIYRWRIILN